MRSVGTAVTCDLWKAEVMQRSCEVSGYSRDCLVEGRGRVGSCEVSQYSRDSLVEGRGHVGSCEVSRYSRDV